MKLYESSNTINLFGDDLSGCDLSLVEVGDGSTVYDVVADGFHVSPSQTINLSSFYAGEDIDVDFSVNQISDAGATIAANSMIVSNAGY